MTNTNTKASLSGLITAASHHLNDNIVASLKTNMLNKEELPEGFRYLFVSTDGLIEKVSNFVKKERLVFDFLRFSIEVINETLWLTITGPEGAKELIRKEIDL